MAWQQHLRAAGGLALALTLAGTLAACGGDDADGKPPTPSDPPPGPASRKVLLIGVDGATYPQVQAALLRKAMPNLAQLSILPAATGGTTGTITAQPPLDGPSWASVLTGTWANRHGIPDDSDTGADAPGMQAPTLFQYLRADGATTRKLGSATSAPVLPRLLQGDLAAGHLDTQVDCAGVDSCVTQHSVQMVQSGYDAVFAQFSAPATAAADEGYENGNASGRYAMALSGFDAALGELLNAVAARKRANTAEDWLVLVATSHGLDRTGATTSVPTVQNRTAFIALNRAPDAAYGLVGAPAPDSESALSALATTADIVPTVLSHAGVRVSPEANGLDGSALTRAPAVRGIGAKAGDYNASLTLSWRNPANAAGALTVLRDGVAIATLDGSAQSYTDAAFDLPDGLHRFNYTLVRNGEPVSYLAQLNYARPVPLAASLRNDLAAYYSFDTLPATDARTGTSIGPWAPGADGGSLIADGFRSRALAVDSNIDSYRLALNGDDIALRPQFTIGFWFKTDCTQGNGTGAPVLSNKNYTSGANAGIAIGLFGSCELRFNIGSGGKRDDINGLRVSAGQWAYVALAVDAANKRFSAYVIDPVRGVQKVENKAIANTDVTRLNGLATKVWGVNDDATHNYVGNNPGALKGVMAFNDLAMWQRLVTLQELQTIDASHQPLSSLNP
jgi:hypothetical protein